MKWALVTGASSGIGEAFAKRIVKQGYGVILVARRADRLQKLAAEIGGNVETIALDLCDPGATKELLSKLEGRFIELLFNNAGCGANGEVCDLEADLQLKMVDLNCRALVELSRAFARPMREAKRGTIIHTASLGGFSPMPYYSVYGATKAFVISFSEALAEELRPHGIVVKTLCPGATESEFEAVSGYRGTRPARAAIQSSDDVARETIADLKSSRSLLVTGAPNRLMARALSFVPRRWATKLAARALRPQA